MDGHNDKCNYSSGVISNTALFCQWQNKNIPIAFIALKCKIMNQKNLMLPFAPTSCASFSSQETPSFVTNNNSASFFPRTHSAQLNQNHLVPTLNQSAKIPASAVAMDQIVFYLCLPRQQHPSGLYLLPWYLLKRKTSQKMLRGSSTPSTHVYYSLHLLFMRIQTIGLRNLWKPCWRTENSLKKPHNKCMKKRSKGASLIFQTKSKLTYRYITIWHLATVSNPFSDIKKSNTAQTGNQWWEKRCLYFYLQQSSINSEWLRWKR